MDDLREQLHDLVRRMDAGLGVTSRDRRHPQRADARPKTSASA